MFDIRRLFAAPRRPDVSTAYGRGLVALETGRAHDAVAAFTDAAAEAPDGAGRAAACNKRGVALVALDRRDLAVAAFCDALAADEGCAPALANIGNLLLEAGHLEDAVDHYDAAIRADDRHAPAYRNLAVALRRLGRLPASVRAFRTAVRLEASRSERA